MVATTCVMDREGLDLAGGIRSMLEYRHAMQIGEIALRLGVDRTRVRDELEAMMDRNEVERLRPVDYPFEDQDFFRLCGGQTTIVETGARRDSVWIRSVPASVRYA